MRGGLKNGNGVTRAPAFSRFASTVISICSSVPGAASAYVATGHGPWGMLNAPATGLALAELIVDGAAKVVDLRAFDPAPRV